MATDKRVLLAAPRGYCAGVDRAVIAVEKALELHGAPIYVRKEIVHNKYVVETLSERGAIFVSETDEVPEGARVVFSAHGVSPAVREAADSVHVMVIGYVNDYVGYLPSPAIIEQGGYEARARMLTPASIAELLAAATDAAQEAARQPHG